jgi:hypothetical protein
VGCSLVGALLLLGACARPDAGASPGAEAYVPGLGEIMAANQMRHLKLWYAGGAGNWPLASYEVDELEEGFADAARFHPHHKQSPRPLTELIPEFTEGPIAALRTAIAQKSRKDFASAFDALTEGCNGCHAETGFSFNVVKRPSGNPYTNQRFEPPRRGRAPRREKRGEEEAGTYGSAPWTRIRSGARSPTSGSSRRLRGMRSKLRCRSTNGAWTRSGRESRT